MDWLILKAGEGRMLMRYAMLSLFLVAGVFLASNGVISLIQQAVPDQSARLSAHEAIKEGTRYYTMTRSVLDDQITTGSIQKVDPCGK